MAVRSSGLQRCPPFPTPQHLHTWSVPPPCRGLMLPPPGLWPPSPLPWQDPCPLHLSRTLPPASRQAPPDHSPLKSGTLFLKQRCLNPLISLHLSGLQCPPRRSPHSPSPSLVLPAGSPSSSQTSPAFQPSPAIPALPVTQEILPEIPLSHSTETPPPLAPELSRLLAMLCVTSLCPPLAPEGSCRDLDCPAGCWAQRRCQQGGQISQLGGREERRDPGITDLELRVTCAPHGSLGALGRGEWQPQGCEV